MISPAKCGTLRHVTTGWVAAGLIEKAWKAAGLSRDKLADRTGIDPGALSGYNTGRLNLGPKNARVIAEATGVTLADLGAPEGVVGEDPGSRLLHHRLAEVEEALEALGPMLAALEGLPERVLALEHRAQPKTRPAAKRANR